MNMRRRLLTGAALITAGALLAGCSANSATTPSEPAANPTGELTFWSAIPGMDLVTEAFNESQDDITVTFEEIPNGPNGGYAKLATAIESGTGPDVAGFEYGQLPQFVGSGSVIALDDLVPAETLDEYSDQVRGLVTFEDATYGLPYDAPPLVTYYRQDVLDAAGVDVPETWDDFEAAARAVRAANPSAYLASYNQNEPAVLAALAWQAGGQWYGIDGDSWKIGIDDKASTKVAEFWQRLIDEDLVKVQPSFSDEWTADLGSGVTNGVIGASWSAAGLKARTEASGQAGKWVAAAPPTWGDDASAFYGGTSFAITKNSKNPAAAAKFLEFVTTDPVAIEARGEVGSAYLAYPGLNEIAAGVFPTEYFANDIYAAFDESYDRVVDGWAWGPNWDITNTALKDSMSTVGAGGTVPDGLTTAQQATVEGLEQLGLTVTE